MGQRRRLISSAAVATLVGAGLVAGWAAPAGAITVTDEASLRAAYADVNETQIDLANDITLADCPAGDLDRVSANALTLDGHGFTITQTCDDERVIENGGTGNLTLEAIGITGGTAVGNGGGGVYDPGGAVLTINNSQIFGNSAPGTGGGGVNADTLVLTNSTVADNDADDFGGGINVVDATIVHSTISGNESTVRAGGISSGSVVLVNSTVSGNTAGRTGGGIFVNDAALVYATVVGNSAANSGANVFTAAELESFGSVVALPDGSENCDVESPNSNGFNFSDDDSCGFTDGTDAENAGDPGLGALADNGGPTQTHLPQTGSPLVDAIATAACQDDGASTVTDDQRGVSRPQGGGCEIGSVEIEIIEPAAPPATPTAAAPAFTG